VAAVVRAADAGFYPFQRLPGSGRSISKPRSSGPVSIGSRRLCGVPDYVAIPIMLHCSRRNTGSWHTARAESSVQGHWRRTPGQMVRHGRSTRY